MQAVVLKGVQDGYEINVAPAAGFDDVIAQLRELLTKLAEQAPANEATIGFNLNSQSRVLSAAQKAEIEAVFAEFQSFEIHHITTDVMYRADALAMMDSRNVHVCGEIIRNGQDVTLKGDVLFLGAVHKGGILRATGTIYILGQVEGIVHAGCTDNYRAVCVGNLAAAQQVRIGDAVIIVAEEQVPASEQTVAFINNLHAIEFGDLRQLKNLRPKLFAKIGGMN